MSCVVTGQPMPEVSWYHNHKCIDKSEDFVITYDRNTGRVDLVIVDCLPDDQGRFRSVRLKLYINIEKLEIAYNI